MKDIKSLKTTLEKNILSTKNTIIVPHKDPDFDTIASAMGISLIASKLKKTSSIIVDDQPSKIDSSVQTILEEAKTKGFTIINQKQYQSESKREELIVLTDVNKLNLIHLNEDTLNEKKIIIIDHHSEDKNTVEADYKYIDKTVSSACEIITKLLCMFKIKYDADIANLLLAGIYLDTNKLTKNTSTETMKMVTKLLESNATIDKVSELFSEDFSSDRKIQELIGRAQFFNKEMIAVIGEQNKEYTKEELAKAADYLLKYKIAASFAIGKINENTISISARSKGKIDVSLIMSKLNGGGNVYSAATKLEDCTPEEAGKILVKTLKPGIIQNN